MLRGFLPRPYTGETPSGSYDFLLLRHTGVREHIVHGAVAHALERLVGAAAGGSCTNTSLAAARICPVVRAT